MKDKSLIAAYFSLGFFALISQTMILREFFVVVYGNEFIFGVLLTNWLAGIFTGAVSGGIWADRSRKNLQLFVGSLLLLAFLFPLSLTGIRFLYNISGTPAGTYIGFATAFIYSALFIMPISFLIGFAFPVAARLHTDTAIATEKKVFQISTIYIFEAFGSLLAGVVYTFFLAGRFNPYFIAGLIILPLLVSCLFILKHAVAFVLRVATILLLLLNLGMLVPDIYHKLEDYTVLKRWRSFSVLPLEFSTDSRYQNIAVARLANRHNLYLNTTFAACIPNDEDNMLLAAHLAVQHPAPGRILVIGDAVSGLAKFLLRFNVKHVVSVEIDGEVVNTIMKFLPAEDKKLLQKDKRFRIEISDGRKYVKDLITKSAATGSKPLFDLVYVNVPEPSTLLLNRYYTQEFFTDLSRLVGAKGVVALKVTASEEYGGGIVTDYTASVYHTLESVFPYTVISPGPQHFIFASRDAASISENPAVLSRRYVAAGVEPQNLKMIFQSLYLPEKIASARQALHSNNRYRINTDETPISSFYYNKIIGWYSKSGVSRILDFFEKMRSQDIFAVIIMLTLFRIVYLAIRHKKQKVRERAVKLHTLLSVFSAGLAGLALELVLLYMFQDYFGDVYYIIGFIIALFMCGLPFGAYAANVFIERKKPGTRQVLKVITVIQALLAMLAFSLPYILNMILRYSIFSQVVIFVDVVIIGFSVGGMFPLAVRLCLENSEHTAKAAGLINAMDHIGAAAGAFFIGSLFLPVMGIVKACALIAVFPTLSALLLRILLLHKQKNTPNLR